MLFMIQIYPIIDYGNAIKPIQVFIDSRSPDF